MTGYSVAILELTLYFILSIALVYLVIRVLKLARVIKLENRITKFSSIAISSEESTLLDRLGKQYQRIIKKLANTIKPLLLTKKLSKFYEKYLYKNETSLDGNEFVATKIVVGLVGAIIALFKAVDNFTLFNLNIILLGFVVAFFIPDIFIFISHTKRKKRIENDLFKAILIMSNAFKSGRSIMQAVEIVANELDGPVADEFRKMHVDLNYGLDIEVVFDRMAKRLDAEETKYMASSLIILNKTGGNVIKVFSSIEKSFTERKRVQDELKSVTALSKFVFYILISVPVIIFLLISILNSSYFTPLFTSPIGLVILSLVIIIYIIYIVVVKRVINIRE